MQPPPTSQQPHVVTIALLFSVFCWFFVFPFHFFLFFKEKLIVFFLIFALFAVFPQMFRPGEFARENRATTHRQPDATYFFMFLLGLSSLLSTFSYFLQEKLMVFHIFAIFAVFSQMFRPVEFAREHRATTHSPPTRCNLLFLVFAWFVFFAFHFFIFFTRKTNGFSSFCYFCCFLPNVSAGRICQGKPGHHPPPTRCNSLT